MQVLIIEIPSFTGIPGNEVAEFFLANQATSLPDISIPLLWMNRNYWSAVSIFLYYGLVFPKTAV
jgi:hypothetical protein